MPKCLHVLEVHMVPFLYHFIILLCQLSEAILRIKETLRVCDWLSIQDQFWHTILIARLEIKRDHTGVDLRDHLILKVVDLHEVRDADFTLLVIDGGHYLLVHVDLNLIVKLHVHRISWWLLYSWALDVEIEP